MWDAFKEHYGKDTSQVLFWRAPSLVMNPGLDQKIIEEAYARDPVAAASEYGAEFRSDCERFVALEVVDACCVRERFELPRVADVRYFAFVDPSGGSADSMTLSIAHRLKSTGAAILDLIREVKPPFSPERVVRDFAATLKSYGISEVVGDHYAGEWPRERFAVHQIVYKPSEKSRSEIYLELLPLLNSRRVGLLDNPKLMSQLVNLERHVARGGRETIDHAPGGHDDVANAAAGALVLAHETANVGGFGILAVGGSGGALTPGSSLLR